MLIENFTDLRYHFKWICLVWMLYIKRNVLNINYYYCFEDYFDVTKASLNLEGSMPKKSTSIFSSLYAEKKGNFKNFY